MKPQLILLGAPGSGKGTQAKITQTHINKKREEKKNPSDDWREGTVWAKKIADEFRS